ncbi:MAG: hypothetical protein NTW50_05155 [Candidatus Berkelbacteria bacterium]|nr:hypothetical protein [Candidatus Berkelbacteria bacterium]
MSCIEATKFIQELVEQGKKLCKPDNFAVGDLIAAQKDLQEKLIDWTEIPYFLENRFKYQARNRLSEKFDLDFVYVPESDGIVWGYRMRRVPAGLTYDVYLLNNKTEELIAGPFSRVTEFRDGLALVQTDVVDKYYTCKIIRKDGTNAFPAMEEPDVHYFYPSGLDFANVTTSMPDFPLILKRQNQSGECLVMIDSVGKVTTIGAADDRGELFSEGVAWVKNFKDGKYRLINQEGGVVHYENTLVRLTNFYNGYCLGIDTTSNGGSSPVGHLYIVSKSGEKKQVPLPHFVEGKSLYSSKAPSPEGIYHISTLAGGNSRDHYYINQKAEIVGGPFESGEDFSDGLANVQIKSEKSAGERKYLRPDGTFAFPGKKFGMSSHFAEGIALVGDPYDIKNLGSFSKRY